MALAVRSPQCELPLSSSVLKVGVGRLAIALKECHMSNLQKQQLRSLFRKSSLVLCIGLLGACSFTSTLPSAKTDFDATVPTKWQQSAATPAVLDAQALSQWWLLFGDSQLESLIEEALINNPDIRSALSSIRIARAERGLEQSQLWPTLSASISATGTHTQDRDNDRSTDDSNYNGSIDASWEIDLFGKQRQYLKAANAELAAATDDFHQVQVSLAAEVAATYLSLCSFEAQLTIVQTSLATRETTLQISQWQEQVGEGDALNTQQSIASAEQARAQIPDLEQSILEARNSLAVLTGRVPQSLQARLQPFKQFPALPESIAVGIPAETLRQRPDIRTAENAILAAQYRLTAAERSRLPSLTLSGSIGLEALSVGDFFDPQYIISRLAAGLSAPIINAGQISRNIKVQAEVLEQAYMRYQDAVLTSLSEVENALSAIKKRSQQLATLERASAAAKQSAELAQMRYEAGEADLLTVLDAQRTELGLDQSRISTHAQVLNAYVQLYKSLGGGWSVPAAIAQR